MSGFQRKPPAFKVGDKVNEFTITYYCGYTDVGPDSVTLTHKFHWYECECSCGEVLILNQRALNKRRKCDGCVADDKSKKMQELRAKTKLPEGVPDFARMKLV
jgi:hypothetical protein